MKDRSRRAFLLSSLSALGGSMFPAAFLASCLPERSGLLNMDFIGSPEKFQFYRSFFRKIRKTELVYNNLENALESGSEAVFLDTDLTLKSTYAVLLIEQNKDILSTFPLSLTLTEYNRIQESLVKYGRILGLINPLRFYPSIAAIRKIIIQNRVPLTEVRIACHPHEIQSGLQVEGPAGSAQLLQRMVSFITGSFPVSAAADRNASGRISRILLDYDSYETMITFDTDQSGWTMEFRGPEFRAMADHTGSLTINDEARISIRASSSVWDEAMTENLENFTEAVRSRSEPDLSSLDALASIILNNSVEESLNMEDSVRL